MKFSLILLIKRFFFTLVLSLQMIHAPFLPPQISSKAYAVGEASTSNDENTAIIEDFNRNYKTDFTEILPAVCKEMTSATETGSYQDLSGGPKTTATTINQALLPILGTTSIAIPFQCNTFFKNPPLLAFMASSLSLFTQDILGYIKHGDDLFQLSLTEENNPDVFQSQLVNQINQLKNQKKLLRNLEKRKNWMNVTRVGIIVAAAVTILFAVLYQIPQTKGAIEGMAHGCQGTSNNGKYWKVLGGTLLTGTVSYLKEKKVNVTGVTIDGLLKLAKAFIFSSNDPSLIIFKKLNEEVNFEKKFDATYILLALVMGVFIYISESNIKIIKDNIEREEKNLQASQCSYQEMRNLTYSKSACLPPTCDPASNYNSAPLSPKLESKLANYRKKVEEHQKKQDELKLCGKFSDKNFELSGSCSNSHQLSGNISAQIPYPQLAGHFKDTLDYYNATNRGDYASASLSGDRLTKNQNAISKIFGDLKVKFNEMMVKKGHKDFDYDKTVKKLHDELMQQGANLSTAAAEPTGADAKSSSTNALSTDQNKNGEGKDDASKSSDKASDNKNNSAATVDLNNKTEDGLDLFDFNSDNELDSSTSEEESNEQKINGEIANLDIKAEDIHQDDKASLFEIITHRYFYNYDKILQKKNKVEDNSNKNN